MRDILADALGLWTRFRDYVTFGLLCTTLLASGMYYVTDLRLEACEANTQAIINSAEAAAAEATLEAERDKQRIEQEYRDRAEQADEEFANLLTRYNASLVRYANRSSPSGPATSSEGGSAGRVDGASESPVVSNDLITIPFSDAEICAENTARLQVAREWALSLDEVE